PLIRRVPWKVQVPQQSAFLSFAHWMNSLTQQHLSEDIYVAKHRYSLCYILLHLKLIVHLLPSQSNDEVSEVFVLMVDAGDDPLCYILEKWTSPPAKFASY